MAQEHILCLGKSDLYDQKALFHCIAVTQGKYSKICLWHQLLDGPLLLRLLSLSLSISLHLSLSLSLSLSLALYHAHVLWDAFTHTEVRTVLPVEYEMKRKKEKYEQFHCNATFKPSPSWGQNFEDQLKDNLKEVHFTEKYESTLKDYERKWPPFIEIIL